MTREDILKVKEGNIRLDTRRLINDINGESDDKHTYVHSIEGGIRVSVKDVNYDLTFYTITADDDIVVFHNNIHGNSANQPFRFDVNVKEVGEDYEVPGVTPVRIDLGVDIDNTEDCWIESITDGRKFHLSDYLYPEKEYSFDPSVLCEGQLVRITIIYNPDRTGRKYKYDIIDVIGIVTKVSGYRMGLTVRCNPNDNNHDIHVEDIYIYTNELTDGNIKEFKIEKIEV